MATKTNRTKNISINKILEPVILSPGTKQVDIKKALTTPLEGASWAEGKSFVDFSSEGMSDADVKILSSRAAEALKSTSDGNENSMPILIATPSSSRACLIAYDSYLLVLPTELVSEGGEVKATANVNPDDFYPVLPKFIREDKQVAEESDLNDSEGEIETEVEPEAEPETESEESEGGSDENEESIDFDQDLEISFEDDDDSEDSETASDEETDVDEPTEDPSESGEVQKSKENTQDINPEELEGIWAISMLNDMAEKFRKVSDWNKYTKKVCTFVPGVGLSPKDLVELLREFFPKDGIVLDFEEEFHTGGYASVHLQDIGEVFTQTDVEVLASALSNAEGIEVGYEGDFGTKFNISVPVVKEDSRPKLNLV